MARPIKRRIDRSQQAYRATREGIIVFVNSDETNPFVNIKDVNGNTYYRIYFGEGVNTRLKRVEQSVLMAQSIYNKYKWVVVGAARRSIGVTDFADQGNFKWDDGTKWNDRHQWL